MIRRISSQFISISSEQVWPASERDPHRRWMLGGFAGVLGALSGQGAHADTPIPDRTTVSPEGIIRTTLQSHVDAAGDEFRLVMTTYPPGVGVPLHHHSTVALNYILEGVAESQYLGEDLKRFTAGQSFQDKVDTPHLVFRNGDLGAPLKYLLAYTVKRGQPFLIVP